jgi:hypothetical protein
MCCFLAAVAYLPILNNSFIADDYVILKRIEKLKTDPLYLYQVPPENFRSVSYLVFGTLKQIAGYRAWPFYVFNIGLHIVNILLLWRLLRLVIEDKTTAGLAVLLFAVFQAPQEAVMWLAAMNETTLLCFTLLTLLSWSAKRYAFAGLFYLLALFSKESAIIIPAFVVLLDWYRQQRRPWHSYMFLLFPALLFFAIFLVTVSNNFMLTSRSYAVGFQAIVVLGKSIHRLLWPWFYIIAAVAWFRMRRAPSLAAIGGCLGVVVITMAPYMFIAYQTSLPSRQLYLASAVLMTLFALLLRPLRDTALLKVVIAAFVAFNVGYLWLRKDGQFEERAAPTTELIIALQRVRPQRTIIKNFAYPFPEVAAAAGVAAGWDETLISIHDLGEECEKCLQLEWNSRDLRYEASAQ